MNFQLVPTAHPQVLEEDFGVEASLFFWKKISLKRTAKALKNGAWEIPFVFGAEASCWFQGGYVMEFF